MRNHNYGRMLLVGMVVGVCGLCWADFDNQGIVNRYYSGDKKSENLVGSYNNLLGLLIDGIPLTTIGNWGNCSELYIYNGGLLRSSGNMMFNYVNEDNVKTGKIVVGISTPTDLEFIEGRVSVKYENVSGTGTLIINGTVKTHDLVVDSNGTFISCGTGESTVDNLSGTGNISLYIDKGKVGRLTVESDATKYSGKVYVGLNGVANIANFELQDVLSSKVLGDNSNEINHSDFFAVTLNNDYYQVSLNNNYLDDHLSDYTVNGGKVEISSNDAIIGARKIDPFGEHYLLELTVSVPEALETAFEDFMSINNEWKFTKIESEASVSADSDPSYLLTSVFRSSIENILAWDFSSLSLGSDNINVVALNGYEVPEPSSLALILCGLVGGYVVWRRNRMAAKASA